MSEKEPTQFPKEERGRPVLVANDETGDVDVLRTVGTQYQGEIGGEVHTTEVVGLELNGSGTTTMGQTKAVEGMLLQPEAQESLARELSQLPLRGDTVNGLFDGKVVDATVGDHRINEITGKTEIQVTSEELHLSRWADIRAFSPEIQAIMEADKETRNAKVGGGTLESLKVREPNEQAASIDKDAGLVEPHEAESAEKTQLTIAAEVAQLPIEVQRAIKDYEMYMSSADRSIKVNGYNRDADEDRKRAQRGIDNLPSAVQGLAKRYYQDSKES